MKNIKEIGKQETFKAIDQLYQEYKLPKVSISDSEWNIFFDVTSEIFNNDNMQNDYPLAMNIILRRALNYAIIDEREEFTINYLIDGLCDLTVFHIYYEEIAKIKEEILNKINKQKIKIKDK